MGKAAPAPRLQLSVVQQPMPLPGIGEDSMAVGFNPKCKSPLSCGFQRAGGVLHDRGDSQIPNHVVPPELVLHILYRKQVTR